VKFRYRPVIRIGPLYFRFSENGFTSWGIKIGRFSRNFTHGQTTIDTPGPGYVQGKRTRTPRRRSR
jgi:hypothetical protein